MTTHIANFGYATGQMLTAKLFAIGSDVAAYIAGSVTEQTNRRNRYAASFTEVTAGEYLLVYFLGADGVGSEYYTFAGTDGESELPWSETSQASIANSVIAALPATSGDWSITRTFQVSGGAKVSGVRMSLVGFAGKADTTGTDGIATIKADDNTFTLRVVTPVGYEDVADTTVVIDGADDTATVTLVATTFQPPTNPLMSRLDVLCLDPAGEAEAGVEVDARIVTVPSGSTNTAFKGNKQTATSGVDGIATFEAPRGAKYQIKRGTAADWQTITIGSTDVTTISSFIGSP